VGLDLLPSARIQYAAGSLGTGIFSTVPAVLLLYFCTQVLAIPAGAAALIVLVPKLWSILWDPFVGRWSDGVSSRFGRRRPFVLAGAIGVGLSFWALFSPPPLAPAGLIWWAGGAYFLLTSFYSLFAVPYLAVPAEISGGEADRARLVSWRITAAMIGVLLGGALAPMLVAWAGGGRIGYATMAAILGLFCVAAMLCPLIMMRRADPPQAPRGDAPVARAGFVRPSGHFLALAAGYVVLLAATGILTAALPYMVTGHFGRGEGEVGTALGIMLLTTIVAVPVWSHAGLRFGALGSLRLAVSLLIAVAAALAATLAMDGGWALLLAILASLGALFAGLQVLPYTIATQLIHAQAHDDGAEGSLTGIWTASEKIGLAVGPAAFGAMLAATGSSGSDGAAALFIAVVGAALALLSLALLAGVSARTGAQA
jgi:Na+/melibiose symporter-like transporter